MRKLSLVLAALTVAATGAYCSHDNVTGPAANTPAVAFINPNPTHAASMIIFAGTNFDQNATFTLRQNAEVKATLEQRVFAAGTPDTRIQIDATIPDGTPVGNYQACVTTAAGTGCYGLPVQVF
jgi:hypothetical protein